MLRQLSDEDRRAIAYRITHRTHVTRAMPREEQRHLLFLEQMLLALGPDLAQAFEREAVVQSREDVALAWFLVMSELIDKTAATGKLVREHELTASERAELFRPRGFFRRRPDIVPVEQTYEVVRSSAPALISPYAKTLGISDWDYENEWLDQDSIDLHRLRGTLEYTLEFSSGSPLPKETCWTRLSFTPMDVDIHRLVHKRIDVNLKLKSCDRPYADLCSDADRGNIDSGLTLHWVLRRAVDESLSEYRLDLAKATLLAEGP